MKKFKHIYSLIGLVPCKLLAWSVPLKDATIVAKPEVQSTSLWWYFIFCVSFIFVVGFGLKSGKEFSNENYSSGFICSAVVIIAGVTLIVAKAFI